ncbi:helix-turn-helix domain-containing protein [Paraburkholderia acidisoli]|uniref:LysR family transcriptional regulator n=1 Tax=Paraburkholderia acidisoli TaxID=2571748 RepID=A0A7Z2GRS1_9BURK|nr:LysR family transcriptional regulator [Paraburkholderia acidisoli]QGZ66767.1 LysR family transcriptional regulator [Paraburkholderia acidisoli]
MNLARLKVLLAVIETGSISAAARVLGRAQSRVTATIQELEAELGFALVVRTAAGSFATTAAARMLPRLRAVFAALDAWRGWRRVAIDVNIAPAGGVNAAAAGLRLGWCALPDAALKTRRLDIFRSLVHAGSMTRVACEMNITQPAVSASVAALERCTRRALFERTPGGLIAAPQARELAEIVDGVLAEVGRLVNDAARVPPRSAPRAAGFIDGKHRQKTAVLR